MDRFVTRQNIDHLVDVLQRDDISTATRSSANRQLIEAEDELGRDLESLQFAEIRTAKIRTNVEKLVRLRDGLKDGSPERMRADEILTHCAGIPEVMTAFCLHLRRRVDNGLL